MPFGFVGDSIGAEDNAMACMSSFGRVGRSRVAVRGL
jgi:hypothetical protein